jgi:hypothetical protein
MCIAELCQMQQIHVVAYIEQSQRERQEAAIPRGDRQDG